jgi:hypothetical protein
VYFIVFHEVIMYWSWSMPHAIVTLQQMQNSTFPQVLCFS